MLRYLRMMKGRGGFGSVQRPAWIQRAVRIKAREPPHQDLYARLPCAAKRHLCFAPFSEKTECRPRVRADARRNVISTRGTRGTKRSALTQLLALMSLKYACTLLSVPSTQSRAGFPARIGTRSQLHGEGRTAREGKRRD